MRKKGRAGADKPMAAGWMYIATCVVTAGASNYRDIWFYFGVTFLTGWALLSIRPKRLSLVRWAILFVIIASLGFLAQYRLVEMQGFLETKLSELFIRFGQKNFDAAESKTAMGRIGSLKQSSRIVMRVKQENGPVPERLRQSTFSTFEGDTWRGPRNFESVSIEPDLVTWNLQPSTNETLSVRIIERVPEKVSDPFRSPWDGPAKGVECEPCIHKQIWSYPSGGESGPGEFQRALWEGDTGMASAA